MLIAKKSHEIINVVDNFLDENPEYKTIDYYTFTNSLEKRIFDEYIEKDDSFKVLNYDEHLIIFIVYME